MILSGHSECTETKRNTCRILVGRPEKKFLLKEPGIERKSNTLTIDLIETGWKTVDIINVAKSRGQ